MVLDKIENKSLYASMHPLFKQAFNFLDEYLKNPKGPGKYEIAGDDLFVTVSNSNTREEGLYEVHDKYIDIQVMIGGQEKVYCHWRSDLEAETEFDNEKDVQFLKDGKDNIEFIFKKGEFMILYPWDVHKPSMTINSPEAITKMVFKVKIK